jgi:hypothetical protein
MWIVKNEHCREGAEIVELFKGNSVFQQGSGLTQAV